MGFFATITMPRADSDQTECTPRTSYRAFRVQELGLRYYNAELGRWPSRDPIEEDGSLNLYAPYRNDPVGWVDFLGALSVEFPDKGRAAKYSGAMTGGMRGSGVDYKFHNYYWLTGKEVDDLLKTRKAIYILAELTIDAKWHPKADHKCGAPPVTDAFTYYEVFKVMTRGKHKGRAYDQDSQEFSYRKADVCKLELTKSITFGVAQQKADTKWDDFGYVNRDQWDATNKGTSNDIWDMFKRGVARHDKTAKRPPFKGVAVTFAGNTAQWTHEYLYIAKSLPDPGGGEICCCADPDNYPDGADDVTVSVGAP